jgi:hypothetical protein
MWVASVCKRFANVCTAQGSRPEVRVCAHTCMVAYSACTASFASTRTASAAACIVAAASCCVASQRSASACGSNVRED